MFDLLDDIFDPFGLKKRQAGEQALDAIARIRKMAEDKKMREKNDEN